MKDQLSNLLSWELCEDRSARHFALLRALWRLRSARHFVDIRGYNASTSEQQGLNRLQTYRLSLSFCWAHMSKDTFSQTEIQIFTDLGKGTIQKMFCFCYFCTKTLELVWWGKSKECTTCTQKLELVKESLKINFGGFHYFSIKTCCEYLLESPPSTHKICFGEISKIVPYLSRHTPK